jgi:putative transcriptional regulator
VDDTVAQSQIEASAQSTRRNPMKRLLVCCLFALLPAAHASGEPNAILLVAKPGLPDPNFSEAVVLVTRGEEGNTVGVILNRPTERHVRDIAPRFARAENFTQPVYAGGPVLRQVLVALYESETPPAAAAFEVLPHVYLTLHPKNIDALLAAPPAKARIYAGFSGWGPRQLEAELDSGSWYVLRATEALIFRRDTTTLWSDLVAEAQGSRTSRGLRVHVALH